MTIGRPELHEILAPVFELGDRTLTLTSGPEDVEKWDSLNHLNMVAAIEERLGVSMSGQEIASIYSVADLIAVLRAHGVEVNWAD